MIDVVAKLDRMIAEQKEIIVGSRLPHEDYVRAMDKLEIMEELRQVAIDARNRDDED